MSVLDELGVLDPFEEALVEADRMIRLRKEQEVTRMSTQQLKDRLSVLLRKPQSGPIDIMSFGLSPEEVELDLACRELLAKMEKNGL